MKKFFLSLLFVSVLLNVVNAQPTTIGVDSQSLEQSPVDVNWCYNTIELPDSCELSYNIGFSGLRSGKMQPIRNENFRADVINKQTKESTKVEINELTYSQLTRIPVTYAFTFWVEYDGHRYLIHGMYDIRARYDKTKIPLTTGCYVIK
ncbi:hypothetical protein SAMN04487900_110131 [Prevotella communis]|uniref:Uncharacterized protein n=1 Tax=Prevotella communis TaxID=2913614 RepID=A0A1H0H5X7_9BACT|nr:hypothetical protein [Prevotella communis]SDO14537.1 hypothetical protein SAMN04487900_110131 [Prevotella communis]